MNKYCGNAVVGQSGGPTSAINATLSGVIRGVLKVMPEKKIGTLYGMRNGVEGLMREDLVDLTGTFDTEEKLRLLERTPAAFLGSCRKRLPDPTLDGSFYGEMFRIFEKYGIRYFFYIGGNDSMDAVAKLSRYVEEHGLPLTVIGIPKTIDNDLAGTDHTPGYGSAAKYVAVTLREILYDCAVYTVPAVTVVEIMGRDAGWLTAAAAAGRIDGGAEPDVICLPEIPFFPGRFLSYVREALNRHPNVVVAVSEGIRFPDGRYVGEGITPGEDDAFGHARLAGAARVLEHLIRNEICCKVRSVELNLPQRCAGHLASARDLREAAKIGFAAVGAAMRGVTGEMMTLTRVGGTSYRVRIGHCPANRTANVVRQMDPAFFSEGPNPVSDAFCRWLDPLIRGEVPVRFSRGLPQYFPLK